MSNTENMNEDTATALPEGEDLTVGQVAELLGISVRTLHHWDEIGLVAANGRTWAGYRLYDAANLTRLRRVLVYRELGVALKDIKRILDDPTVDPIDELGRQRAALETRIAHLRKVLSAVDRIMEVENMNKSLSPREQAEILGPDWDPEWHAEAQQSWGDTPEWQQSEQVKAKMSPADWQRVKDDTEDLEARLAQAFTQGVEPGSAAANDLAEAHRASIAQWFDVSYAKHVLIARGYTQDPRFANHYDKRQEGLAAWLAEVINANAQAHGVDPATAEWK